MPYTGVLFDLFGTLVAPYRTSQFREVMRLCAKPLGISFEDCYRLSEVTNAQRTRGWLGSMADNFAEIARLAGRPASREAVMEAERIFERFTLESLEPADGALDLLAWLTGRGLRLGLVSNCAPDVPKLWNQLPFATYFGYCAFSCQMGMAKPKPEIYRAALDALALRPEETLYVGDDSVEELPGAVRCGMRAVLVMAELSNTVDAQRADVDGWTGLRIHNLADLRPLIEEIVR